MAIFKTNILYQQNLNHYSYDSEFFNFCYKC